MPLSRSATARPLAGTRPRALRRVLGSATAALAVCATALGMQAAPSAATPPAASHRHAPGASSGHSRASSGQHGQAAGKHSVTFDKYSLKLDGNRTWIWSGEFHPFRLPSPDLWRDVLQKMKASGYNAVSIYFDWGYHSSKQGVYDFSGVRDMDRALSIAQEVGLYVIARPGPYINAETDAGGFPGWLTTQAGRARTDAADYLAATDEWQAHIDPIIARHQLSNGTGT